MENNFAQALFRNLNLGSQMLFANIKESADEVY